jgi:hypothetical protein
MVNFTFKRMLKRLLNAFTSMVFRVFKPGVASISISADKYQFWANRRRLIRRSIINFQHPFFFISLKLLSIENFLKNVRLFQL